MLLADVHNLGREEDGEDDEDEDDKEGECEDETSFFSQNCQKTEKEPPNSTNPKSTKYQNYEISIWFMKQVFDHTINIWSTKRVFGRKKLIFGGQN